MKLQDSLLLLLLGGAMRRSQPSPQIVELSNDIGFLRLSRNDFLAGILAVFICLLLYFAVSASLGNLSINDAAKETIREVRGALPLLVLTVLLPAMFVSLRSWLDSSLSPESLELRRSAGEPWWVVGSVAGILAFTAIIVLPTAFAEQAGKIKHDLDPCIKIAVDQNFGECKQNASAIQNSSLAKFHRIYEEFLFPVGVLLGLYLYGAPRSKPTLSIFVALVIMSMLSAGFFLTGMSVDSTDFLSPTYLLLLGGVCGLLAGLVVIRISLLLSRRQIAVPD